MSAVYVWLRGLTGYFLFLAVLDQLLPEKENGRYVRLFAGMVLIILLIRPLAGAEMTDHIARFYEKLEFRYDARQFRKDISGVEAEQYDRLIGSYEKAVAEDIEELAAACGYDTAMCRVVIDRDKSSGEFGTVRTVELQLYRPAERRAAADTFETESGSIGRKQGDKSGDAGKSAQEPAHALSSLRRSITSQYHLEDQYVEIQLLERQG